MKIQVLSVQITTTPTAKGSYQTADVAYKNLTFQGKVEGKKVMSFGATKDSFSVLATAQPNDVYDVNVVKNDKGYNDWVSMTKGTADGQASAGQSAKGPASPAATPARTSTYETPEERAKKQIYIIRQSSLNHAIATLSCGAKSALKRDEVVELAAYYTDFVLGSDIPKANSVDAEFPLEAE